MVGLPAAPRQPGNAPPHVVLSRARRPCLPSESGHSRHFGAKQVGLGCALGGVGQAPRMVSMARTGLVALFGLVS